MAQPPPDLVALAGRRRFAQQSIVAHLVPLLRQLWRRIDPSQVLSSWERVAGPRALTLVTAGQLAAADDSQAYVAAALELQGMAPDPLGVVVASALAGFSSDGRDLAGLLRQPALATVGLLASGMKPEVAMPAGLSRLETIAATQVQDAGRVATGVAQVADRRVAGYIRYLVAPSCSRCVILAGRWYAHNAGFPRHPRCDCIGIPAAEAMEPQDPRAIFASMSQGQLRSAGWAEADIKAIEAGADIFQVTNARRGLQSTSLAGRQVQVTRVGTNRQRPVRLTPESIYQIAGSDRDEAVRLLRANGYIV